MNNKEEIISILAKKIISRFKIKGLQILFQKNLDKNIKEPLTVYIFNSNENPVEYIEDVKFNLINKRGIITSTKVIIEFCYEIIIIIKYLLNDEMVFINIPRDINIKCKTKHDMKKKYRMEGEFIEELFSDEKFYYRIEIPLKYYNNKINDFLKDKTLASNPNISNFDIKFDYIVDGPAKIDKDTIFVTPIEISLFIDLLDNITVDSEIKVINYKWN